MFHLRPYAPHDHSALLALLRSNTPRYFHPSEEADFKTYLATDAHNYFVAEADGRIIGAGGFNWENDRTTGILSWDMVHPDYQGKGCGRSLVEFRIQQMLKAPTIRRIKVRTSQLSFLF